jgi:hypothetical protein
MATPSGSLPEAIAAASSADWAERARAGEQLARWAHLDEVIPVLRVLLLDPADTAVTDATCAALLQRDDSHGIRVIAHSVATSPDAEYLDHIKGQVITYFLADGPIHLFLAICTGLVADQDQAVAAGARKLLHWSRPWAS